MELDPSNQAYKDTLDTVNAEMQSQQVGGMRRACLILSCVACKPGNRNQRSVSNAILLKARLGIL